MSELNKLQDKQRAAVARAHRNGGGTRAPLGNVHPDLHDLNFGALGSDAAGLPSPIRPSGPDSPPDTGPHGSLSDFSDYDSSDQETHNRRSSDSPSPVAGKVKARMPYRSFSNEDLTGKEPLRQALPDDSDPFADPDVSTPGIAGKQGMVW